MTKTTIIKIGTESLENFETSEKVDAVVEDVAQCMRRKIDCVLISSGAVGCGRELCPEETDKQVLAAIGQPLLMGRYAEKFTQYGIRVAQVLPTHDSIKCIKSHRKQYILTIRGLLARGVLPIINENDALSTAEMRELKKGTDNDANALLAARLLHARQMIFVTNTNGVYRDKDNPNTRIHTLSSHQITSNWIRSICSQKSTNGTGGMQSKLKIARKFGRKYRGSTFICDGIQSRICDIFSESTKREGTLIVP